MKSKKIRGGTLKREELEDPNDIHKLRLIELSDKAGIVEYEDYNTKITSSETEINILYVIDMQNDFINPSGPKETDGQFSVLGGSSIVDPLIKFISSNKDKFRKIIFSRDYHEANHCGFIDNGGIHPPHCVQTRFGSQFDARIKKFLTCELLNDETSKEYEKTEIVFKAMEMESFGASKATNTRGKWYTTHPSCQRKYINCMVKKGVNESVTDSKKKCLNLTGGFKSNKPKQDSIGDSIETDNLREKYDIEDVINEINNKTKVHNIYITGLAGCHCVSETAINIADYLNTTSPKIDYQIYIIEDLTRYAFLPLSVSPPETFSNVKVMSRLQKKLHRIEERHIDLSLYIFEMIMEKGNPAPKFKLLTSEEVRENISDILQCATAKPGEDSFLKYFHYLESLKGIIDKYKKYSGKIKLIMNETDTNLETILREPVGGGRKTKKKKKSRKKKSYKRKEKKRKNKKISKRSRY
tara:strand:+ start:18 stop:1424 length:1407 start_codon:yes stop_codon:yes gene_type:complete